MRIKGRSSPGRGTSTLTNYKPMLFEGVHICSSKKNKRFSLFATTNIQIISFFTTFLYIFTNFTNKHSKKTNKYKIYG